LPLLGSRERALELFEAWERLPVAEAAQSGGGDDVTGPGATA
jgi:hypothetical protein